MALTGVGQSLRISGWAVLSMLFFLICGVISLRYTDFFRLCNGQDGAASLMHISGNFIFYVLFPGEWLTYALTILAVFVLDKLVCNYWSKLEVFVFILVIDFVPLIISSFLVYFTHVFELSCVAGFPAFVAAVTVVAAQFDSQRILIGYRSTGLKSQYSCFIGFLLYMIGAFILNGMYFSSLVMYINGFFVSWIYLRFCQYHNRRYGDHRATFTLSGWVLWQWNSV